MKTKLSTAEQRVLIEAGLQKATQQMLKKAALLDEEVVISRKGKVQRVKAKELVSGLPSAE
jgi:hypothetical protein